MNRKLHVALLLLILFSTATVLAGMFSLGDLSVSVSASAVCGTIPTSEGNVPHYYNNVTTITDSSGNTHTLEARYQISWETSGSYTTSKKATIRLSGHVYVIDSNGCKSGAGDTYSYDEDVKGGWFGGERTDSVSTSDSFLWTTTTSGCYTARIDGEGEATSVSGGGGQGAASVNIRGVTLKISGGYNDPEVRTRHTYTRSASDTIHPVFTHRSEDSFFVGTDTKYLSNYQP